MPKRPWKSYRPLSGRAYVPKWKKTGKGRKYTIKHVPESKIRMFTIGKESSDYYYMLILNASESGQINHLSLEAARIACNKYLRERLGRNNYVMKVLPYPHHVVREHKLMAFAGADRLQDGMRKAFGKPFGRAARVRENQKLMIVKVHKDALDKAKAALNRARMKFPMPCRIVLEKIKSPETALLDEEEKKMGKKIKRIKKVKIIEEEEIMEEEEKTPGEKEKKAPEKEKTPGEKEKKAPEKGKTPGEKEKKLPEKGKKTGEKEKKKGK